MATLTPYRKSYSFAGFQASSPTTPLPAVRLDDELSGIETAISSLVLAVRAGGGVGSFDEFITQAELDSAIDAAIAAIPPSGGGGGSTAWADITGKPPNFTPSPHAHAVSDITGLQAVLDGKASAGHVHDLSGVIGLQAALDGKAASLHGHVIADVTGLQAALDAKVGATSPTLLGVPLAPTAAPGTNTTQIATTAFVTAAVAAGGGGAPGGALLANETVPLSGDWNAGSFAITGLARVEVPNNARQSVRMGASVAGMDVGALTRSHAWAAYQLTEASDDAWGFHSQVHVPSTYPQSSFWCGAVYALAVTDKVALPAVFTDVSAVVAQAKAGPGLSYTRVHGIQAEAYIASSSEGLGLGVEAAVYHYAVNSSAATPWDHQNAKINLLIASPIGYPQGYDTNSAGIVFNGPSEAVGGKASWLYGMVMINTKRTGILLMQPGSGCVAIDINNSANWGAAIRVPNNVPVTAWNSAGNATHSILHVDTSNQLTVGGGSASVYIPQFTRFANDIVGANNKPLRFRNAANTADLNSLYVDGSNYLQVGFGAPVVYMKASDGNMYAMVIGAADSAQAGYRRWMAPN